jgi:hypothetical protein
MTMLICLHDDRESGEVGLRIAVASILRGRPDARVRVHRPNASVGFKTWLKQFDSVDLQEQVPGNAEGWNIKPHVLLQALAEGETEVVWMDSDILVHRDPTSVLSERPAGELVLVQEPANMAQQGLGWRSREWTLPVKRDLAFTLNTCVIRVTTAHTELLERWLILLQRGDYLAEQKKTFLERRMAMRSDQDAFCALLGSIPTAELKLHVLESGRDVIHSGGLLMYGLGERFRGLPVCQPYFIHALADKPWLEAEMTSGMLGRVIALSREVSPYVSAARAYVGEVNDFNLDWLRNRTVTGRILSVLGLGHIALRGLPLTLLLRLSKSVNSG